MDEIKKMKYIDEMATKMAALGAKANSAPTSFVIMNEIMNELGNFIEKIWIDGFSEGAEIKEEINKA